MKKIITTVLVCIMMISFVGGCPYRYKGEHKDLYTVAINNIFGANGYRSNGEVVYGPYIDVIETDDFGRVFFFYDEGYHNELATAIVIMQKSEGGFVYYYQDICQISCTVEKGDYKREELNYLDFFSEEQIESLKEANDWNKPIDIEKCTKNEIVDSKNDKGGLGLEREDFDKVIEAYVCEQGYKGEDIGHLSRFFVHCNTDKYGREIYYVYAVGFDVKGEGISPNSEHKTYEFAIIFNPDKSSTIENVYEITDPNEIYEAVRQHKENCGWDTPYN